MKTFSIPLLALVLSTSWTACNRIPQPSEADVNKPDLSGMVAYESHTPSGDQGIWICQLSQSAAPVNISKGWGLYSAGSPAFSPDGRTLVFQAVSAGVTGIYTYDITTGKQPVCLTANEKGECKTPVFSPDGKSVLFSKAGQVARLDIATGKITTLTFDSSATCTDPVISDDGSTVLYAYTPGLKSQLGCLDVASKSSGSLFFDDNVANSKPVFHDGDAFCYVSKPSGENSRINAVSSIDAEPVQAVSEKGCNITDPAPAEGAWILVAKTNGLDGFDIYAANINSGKTYSLDEYVPGINGSGDQRRPTYTDRVCTIAEPAEEEKPGPDDGGGDDIPSDTAMPQLKGKLVYHNYTSYDDLDSQMYIYDFATDRLTNISANWKSVYHAMNGHFSQDGRYLTFMGISSNGGSWDVFKWEVGSSAEPVNLTGAGNWRDEDPKFSFKGDKICFKRNDQLAEITLSTGSIKVLTSNDAGSDPYSMPYYSTDDSKILFTGGLNPNSYIAYWDLASGRAVKLYDAKETVEYYNITLDDKSFYYTQHVSPSDHHDQIYKGFWDGSTAQCLAFNKRDADYSDACPVASGWLVLCSTKSGSKGGYDLYIAHETSGKIYSLSSYNKSINTSKNELGASYTAGN